MCREMSVLHLYQSIRKLNYDDFQLITSLSSHNPVMLQLNTIITDIKNNDHQSHILKCVLYTELKKKNERLANDILHEFELDSDW